MSIWSLTGDGSGYCDLTISWRCGGTLGAHTSVGIRSQVEDPEHSSGYWQCDVMKQKIRESIKLVTNY